MPGVDDGRQQRRARGERLFREICGAPPAAMQADFLDITIEHVFGEVWARDDVATRDQRLLTIAVLTTLGDASALEIHVRMALESGDLQESELQGAVVHLAHYAGWPRGSMAFQVLAKVIAERRAQSADGGR